tara:strand:- start:84 stop:365 length:282 start_codon:yes stop_codon:yes gene_type:complete
MNIDEILEKRELPHARSGLAQDIIAAAMRNDRNLPFMNEMFLLLAIPRPQIVLAMCLVLGLALGLTLDASSWLTDSASLADEDVLFYLDEGWL